MVYTSVDGPPWRRHWGDRQECDVPSRPTESLKHFTNSQSAGGATNGVAQCALYASPQTTVEAQDDQKRRQAPHLAGACRQ
eukprot:1453671-Pyramimonas_sp.AAC.1